MQEAFQSSLIGREKDRITGNSMADGVSAL
jgi:hypothetical protein